MNTQIHTVNELVEECKDYTVKEMKPTLDILFNAYDYEKKQHQIMDTLSAEEYDLSLIHI